jgi:hypothetical protein
MSIFPSGRDQARITDDAWRDVTDAARGLFEICTVLSPHTRPC